MVFMSTWMTGSLSKAMIETTLATTGDVDQRPLKDHPLGLIDMKCLIDHVLNHSARLRNAKHESVIRRTP